MTHVTVLLSLLGLYVAIGILFSIPFVLSGVKRLDPHAASGTWGFRMLIIPGTVFLWPLLLRRWISGDRQPPTQRASMRGPSLERSNPDSMTRSHRQRHRRIWIALAVFLPLLLLAGLVSRRPVPVMHGVGTSLDPRPLNLSPR